MLRTWKKQILLDTWNFPYHDFINYYKLVQVREYIALPPFLNYQQILSFMGHPLHFFLILWPFPLDGGIEIHWNTQLFFVGVLGRKVIWVSLSKYSVTDMWKEAAPVIERNFHFYDRIEHILFARIHLYLHMEHGLKTSPHHHHHYIS